MSTKKTVCIVGAGPAGLVSAKTLLQYGGFDVFVLEVADAVGGMWRANDKCSTELRTNLSRFTVAFSDLSWSSVDLTQQVLGSKAAPTPMFPKAWQVRRYLETYCEKYDLFPCIILNMRVIKARVVTDESHGLPWEVMTENTVTKERIHRRFDHLIVASGFFAKPARSFDPSPGKSLHNIQHSSSFRTISTLVEEPGKIAVIGGGISGSEAAAQAAFQISNARHAPGAKSLHSKSKVYHIINRPFYCLPRYTPLDPQHHGTNDLNLAPRFMPLDIILYNLSRRGAGDICASITEVPSDKAQKGHEFMRSLIGGDQDEYGQPELVYKPDQLQYPAYCGITDTYMEFVRSGLIVPVRGWVSEVKQQSSNDKLEISLYKCKPWYHAASEQGTPQETLEDVTGVIEATGYYTDLHGWLECVDMLHYDSSSSRIPFLLTRGSIFSQQLPTIGFVGFYEGPYWGVMEQQAHIIAKSWSAPDFKPQCFGWPKDEFHNHEANENLRNSMRVTRSLQVPQFSMGDYVGLMEELSRKAGLRRDDHAFDGQTGPVIPSRYHGSSADSEAVRVIEDLCQQLKESEQEARFVAAAVFRGIQGKWTMKRKIESRNVAAPGGDFEGTAHFHPRDPTASLYSAEYLYIEEGTFKMSNGFAFPANRRYVYRYNESTDKITAWFTEEDGESTGTLFNTWDFFAPKDVEHGWMAQGHHWCDPDTYRNTCEFKFKGAAIQTFSITYQVEGPKKNYSHKSWYKRQYSKQSC